MMPIITDLGIVVVSYLLGCFSTGYYLAKWQGHADIRNTGSGATGATNAGRLMGTPGFIITALGDILKGVLAIAIAQQWQTETWIVSCALVAVMAGHVWPVQLNFKGGKAIAVLGGSLILYNPWLLLYWLPLFALSYVIRRQYVPAGLISIGLLPILQILTRDSMHEFLSIFVAVGLIFYAHRANLKTLFGSAK